MTKQSKPHSLRLQSRDKQIVHATFLCRVLLAAQVNALFFTNHDKLTALPNILISSNCRKRLEKLSENGILYRKRAHSVFEVVNPPYLYFLDKDAVPILINDFGYRPDEIYWKPSDNKKIGSGFLKHLVDTNSVRVVFDLAAQLNSYHISTWISDTQLRQRQKQLGRKILAPDRFGKLRKKALVPDGFFKMVTKGYEYPCFLELDRGTETVETDRKSNSIEDKLLLYKALLESEQLQEHYGVSAGRVLFVIKGRRGTSGVQRMKNIVTAAKRIGCGEHFWFSLFDEVLDPTTVLQKQIWTVTIGGERRRLVW